jgi:effector-binding domain-containing protein
MLYNNIHIFKFFLFEGGLKMDIHFKTQEKINNVKQKIKEKVKLKEIIKQNFGNSHTRYKEWLDKYNSNFTADELDFLNYTVIVEDVDVDSIQENKEIKEVKEESSILTVPVPSANQVALMSRKDRENFLLSNAVIQKLVNLLTTQTNTKEITEIDDIIKDTRHLRDIKPQNLRISEVVYKEFVDICKKNNLTITNAINSLLLDFIDKFK